MGKRAPIITLTTDFGLRDEYVAVMKGVILSVNEEARIVDVTHHVTRHDIQGAAWVIRSAFAFFPRGSIHVVVVDPGVGGQRSILCTEQQGHLFLAPDNGVLSLVVPRDSRGPIYTVSNKAYFLPALSQTFHGRDVFAPVAARLSTGEVEMSALGRLLPPGEIKRLDIPEPSWDPGGRLAGQVVAIDHFGNLITNIDAATYLRFLGKDEEGNVVVHMGHVQIEGLAPSYDAVAEGQPVALFGSRDLLEISVNQGDARDYFHAQVGQDLILTRRSRRDGERR